MKKLRLERKTSFRGPELKYFKEDWLKNSRVFIQSHPSKAGFMKGHGDAWNGENVNLSTFMGRRSKKDRLYR